MPSDVHGCEVCLEDVCVAECVLCSRCLPRNTDISRRVLYGDENVDIAALGMDAPVQEKYFLHGTFRLHLGVHEPIYVHACTVCLCVFG